VSTPQRRPVLETAGSRVTSLAGMAHQHDGYLAEGTRLWIQLEADLRAKFAQVLRTRLPPYLQCRGW
jgi:hypothetical protein